MKWAMDVMDLITCPNETGDHNDKLNDDTRLLEMASALYLQILLDYFSLATGLDFFSVPRYVNVLLHFMALHIL